ncbi:hypothetical protein ACHAW6_003348 [Cyclotella cf. meneghiniana]
MTNKMKRRKNTRKSDITGPIQWEQDPEDIAESQVRKIVQDKTSGSKTRKKMAKVNPTGLYRANPVGARPRRHCENTSSTSQNFRLQRMRPLCSRRQPSPTAELSVISTLQRICCNGKEDAAAVGYQQMKHNFPSLKHEGEHWSVKEKSICIWFWCVI